MVTDEKRAKWRRLADAATKGPWRVEVYGHDHADDEFEGADAWSVEAGELPRTAANIVERTVAAFDRFFHPTLAKAERKADADFTAAAREAVPALLDEVERLRAERDEALDVLRPSMRESGLVDACRQRMQAYISERDNCVALLRERDNCVALLRERDALRAWERDARAAMALVGHTSACGMLNGHIVPCVAGCPAAALRAVLARKVT